MSRTNLLTVLIILAMNDVHSVEKIGQVYNYARAFVYFSKDLKNMEFVKNNLAIIVSSIVAVVSGCFNVFQYFENKLLKRHGTEKDLKRREAELEKLRNNHRSSDWLLSRLGEKEEEKNDFICKEKKLLAEIEYLEKILK